MRDLTDVAHGAHAMQIVVANVLGALRQAWGCDTIVHRPPPVVSVTENYDGLYYPRDGAARDARYTRWIDDKRLLRTQTSAGIPGLLTLVSRGGWDDLLCACPGLVYRRDSIDRLHVGEPHQLDLWRIRSAALGQSDERDLDEMIAVVVEAALPGREWRTQHASHPYTQKGRQIDVREAGAWVEVGECGVALPALLDSHGLSAHQGLAMGLGLDRIVMLRKKVPDIRLLRAQDPRVATQMLDLSPYRPVSLQPPIRRDLSIVIAEDRTAQELGDRVREALGDRAVSVESVQIVEETSIDALPEQARVRLGIHAGQKNVLLRVTMRDPERTLTSADANHLRECIWKAVHEGR
jgi:phenylalanyl-tRNA synthetase alpha chain